MLPDPTVPEPIDTRQTILLAAERVFAEKGYNGASVRDIAKAAGANLGLIAYYFGSKDRLFVAVVNHRHDAWHGHVHDSVQAAIDDPDACFEDFVRAFIRPFLRFISHEGEGWRNYLRLCGRGMNVYSSKEVHPALRGLSSIPDSFKQVLQTHFHIPDRRQLDIASYLMEVALTYMVQDRGLIDARTDAAVTAGCMEAAIDDITRFFTGGLVACCHLPRKPRRKSTRPSC